MKTKFIFSFILLFLGYTSFSQSNTGNKFNIITEKNNSNKLIVQFNLKEYSKNIVTTSKGDAIEFLAENSSGIQLKDAPELPKFVQSIIISENSQINISVADSKYIELENILITPSKGVISREKNPSEIPYEFGDTYLKDEFFPGKIVESGHSYILRDFTGQTILVYPFQYNPVKQTLRIYTEIVLEISDKNGSDLKNLTQIKSIDREFSTIYKQQFLNFNQGNKYTPAEEEGSMLVVCHTNYMETMQSFVNWKNQRGIKTEMIEFSTIGTTAEELKAYIINYYNTTGLTYLLLVGDAEHIPSLEKSGDSDAAYGHILGDDSYAEVFVGRFSAQSVADVETQVQRTVYYEKEVGTDASWLSKAIGIASDEGTGGEGDDGESDAQHMDNIRTDLLNFGYNPVEQIYDPGASATTVATKINEGVGLIDYIGHGGDTEWVTTGFSNSDVGNLTNENMLPFIFDVACVNGNFHNQTCFAESWMRATKNSNPTGAIAIIASTINQSWSSPMDGQDEMIDILTESYESNIKRSFGGITVNGIMHMIDEYGSDGSDMANTWTIFGDPSLLVRTTTPAELVISHPSTIIIGSNQITVTGDNDAFISLTKENNIIASGIIKSGSIILEFDNLNDLIPLNLTATAYNKVTYFSEIEVVPSTTPYVVKDNIIINDILGNDNGIMEYGESTKLTVQLKNISVDYDAFNVSAKLFTADSNIVILDSLETYGTILVDTVSLIENVFSFEIDNNILDQSQIKFNLELTGEDVDSNPYTWDSNFNLIVNAPKIEIGDLIIDDCFGDNDGILDPGETANLKLVVANNGHAFIDGLTGLVEFVGGSTYFTIIDTTAGAFSINAGLTDTIEFSVSASIEELLGVPVELKFSIIDNNYNFYSASVNKILTIGEIPEYLISQEGIHTLTVNSLFYDSGGSSENYSNNENYTITFMPPNTNSILKIIFNTFEVEPDEDGCYDILSIYDGENTSATKIGDYCSANPPIEIFASNASGALTFTFYSDGYVDESGWDAEIYNLNTYSAKFVVNGSKGLVENALVSFNNEEKLTNASGEVTFERILPLNDMPYIIRKEGFENYINTIDINSDVIETMTLTPGVATYQISFNVTNGSSALNGAIIILDEKQGITDSNGDYTFSDIEIGTSKIYTITKDKYFNYTDTIDVDSNKQIDVVMNLEAYTVTFNVNSTSLSPIENVKVNFNSSNVYTDSNGKAEFVNIEPKSDLIFTISKSGYETLTDTIDVIDDDVILNLEMSAITSVDELIFSELSVYPNPSYGIVYVNFRNIKGNAQINVYDIIGKSVYSKYVYVSNINIETIDLSNQPKGLYFVTFLSDSGEKVSKKILLK